MATRKKRTPKKKATRRKAPKKKATRKKASKRKRPTHVKRSAAAMGAGVIGGETVWRRNNWEIEIFRGPFEPTYLGYRLVIHNKKTWFSEYPVRYDDGVIAFDRPEAIPKYVKEALVRTYERYLGDPAYLRRYPDGTVSRY